MRKMGLKKAAVSIILPMARKALEIEEVIRSLKHLGVEMDVILILDSMEDEERATKLTLSIIEKRILSITGKLKKQILRARIKRIDVKMYGDLKATFLFLNETYKKYPVIFWLISMTISIISLLLSILKKKGKKRYIVISCGNRLWS